MRVQQQALALDWVNFMQRALQANLDDWHHWANLTIGEIQRVLQANFAAQSGGGGILGALFSGLGSALSGGFGSFSGQSGVSVLGSGGGTDVGGFAFQHGADIIVPGGGGVDNVPFAAMLTPGERVTVTPRSQVGRDEGITVNMNFSLGVQQTVRAEILQLMPKIKKTMIDAVRQEALTSTRFKSALS